MRCSEKHSLFIHSGPRENATRASAWFHSGGFPYRRCGGSGFALRTGPRAAGAAGPRTSLIWRRFHRREEPGFAAAVLRVAAQADADPRFAVPLIAACREGVAR